jgi:hypothetical protein
MDPTLLHALRIPNEKLLQHILKGKADKVIQECDKRKEREHGIMNVFDILYWISYLQWEQLPSDIPVDVNTTIYQMDDMIKAAKKNFHPSTRDDIQKMKNIRVCLAKVVRYLLDSGKSIQEIDHNLYTPPLTK